MKRLFVNFSDDGKVVVNNSVASEEVFYSTATADNSSIEYPYTVPEGAVFALNDYRISDYTDLRNYGAVSIDDMDGTVTLLIRRRGF